MALFSGDAGITAAAGSMTAAQNGFVELPGESPFQKMIAQILANNGFDKGTASAMQAETAAAQNSGTPQETNSIVTLLAGLFSGSSNQTKLKLQTTADVSENREAGSLQDDHAESSKLRTESPVALLTMSSGPFSACLIADSENAASDPPKNRLGANALAALIGPVQTVGEGFALTGQKDNLTGIERLNSRNVPAGSAKPTAQIVDGSGRMTILADIGGKKAEFTGMLSAEPAEVSTGANGLNDIAGKTIAPADTTRETTLKGMPVLLNGNPENDPNEGGMMNGGLLNGLKDTAQQRIKIAEAADDMPGESFRSGINASADKSESVPDSMGDTLKTAAYQSQIQSAGRTGNAEASQTIQPAENPEAYSQIRDEIAAKLEQNGPTEFKMQLEPEDLGQIDIKLKLSEGKLVIDILAANSKTQALLTSQVDKLIASMGLQNVQIESVQVSQQMNPQAQDSSQSQGYGMNAATDFSQRRQQEQYQQEIFRNAGQAGTFSLRQDEMQADSRADRIESIRYVSHRMDYTV